MPCSRRVASHLVFSRAVILCIHDIPPVMPSSIITVQRQHALCGCRPPSSTASCCSTRTDCRPSTVHPTCEARSRVRSRSKQDPGFNIHASRPWHPSVFDSGQPNQRCKHGWPPPTTQQRQQRKSNCQPPLSLSWSCGRGGQGLHPSCRPSWWETHQQTGPPAWSALSVLY